MACSDRFVEGSHECEFSIEGIEGFPFKRMTCHKNPDHTNFIPVKELDKKHIPSNYRKEDHLLETLHAQADLTLLLIRSSTSKKRTRDDEHKNAGVHAGTGHVRYIKDCEQRWCSRACHHRHLVIGTASHVIFDQTEANNTKLQFSFHIDNNYQKKTDIKLATEEARVKFIDGEGDHTCLEICLVGNDDLIATIDIAIKKYEAGVAKELSAYSSFSKLLVPIVSHLHGCEKQLSFGYICHEDGTIKRVKTKNCKTFTKYSPLFYTTPTCPGSSGADVPVYGYNFKVTRFVHSSDCQPYPCNKSCVGCFWTSVH